MNAHELTLDPRPIVVVVAIGLVLATAPEPTQGADPKAERPFQLVNIERVDAAAAGSIETGPDARPRTLVSADFDEDGIPDLVVGFDRGERGSLVLYPGNRHAIYPHGSAPSLTDAPFRRAGVTITTSTPADLLAAGDFDGDGRRDLVVGDRGIGVLELHAGRGDGSFAVPSTIELGGRLTALAAGEIHRRDGVPDLVVAVVDGAGPGLVILRDSRGALHAEPERLSLPAAATELLLGDLDNQPASDLAVVAGGRLWFLPGNERGDRTSLEVVPQAGTAVAVGDGGDGLVALSVTGELTLLRRAISGLKAGGGPSWSATLIGRVDIDAGPPADGGWTMTSCRMSVAPTPDLLLMEAATGRLSLMTTSLPADPPGQIEALPAPLGRRVSDLAPAADQRPADGSVTSAPKIFDRTLQVIDLGITAAAVLPMRLSPDAFDDLVLLTVNPGPPQVVKTVARATFTVDSTADDDDAAIGDGVCATAAGACTLRAAISEANVTTDLDDIEFAIPTATDPGCIAAAGICTIQPGVDGLPTVTRPVVLDATTQPGFAGTPLIELDGTLTGANVTGIAVWGGGTTVRGFAVNRFANNSDVLFWNLGNNIIEGNFLGTDPGGTANVGSLNSVHVSGISGTTVGGTAAEARNLISGNTGPALALNSGATGNFIEGNTFGLDVTGTVGLGNSGNDLLVMNASIGNTIGGTAAGAGNTIAANQASDFPSVGLAFGASANLIQGNRIGTDIAGAALGNLGISVTVVDAAGNTIGGAVAGAGNVIAFNGSGIDMRGDTSTGNTIVGNSIHDNDALGIDLCAVTDPVTNACLDADDVTPNDPGDPDTGANDLQNFPVLASVDWVTATVAGELDSIPLSSFTIDLYVNASCDPSGHGEGEVHVGSTPVATDVGGIAPFAMALPASPVSGSSLTATATDAGGSTSELSACLEIPPAADLRLGKRDFIDPVAPGDTVVYGLDLSNTGPDDASGVVVTDVLPADVVFVSATPPCVHASGTVTCDIGDLAPLAEVSLVIEVTALDPPGGELSNTATVSLAEQDPSPGNNSATETTGVDDSVVFADGFETGDTTRWSVQEP
jgi:uncharacterized repeat protein (TIGR01451 family)/CSLREA domain-containing protein